MADQVDYQYYLFLSFAEADHVWVQNYLLPALDLSQERIITKHGFQPGADKLAEFERAVTSSRFTVLVLSQAYLEDEWSTFEGKLASYFSVAEQCGRLIPLRLQDCELPLDIDFRVSLDCTEEANWESEIARLRDLLPPPSEKEIVEIPFAVVTMIHSEAEGLASRFLGNGEVSTFDQLLKRLKALEVSLEDFCDWYKDERDRWSPFGADKNIRQWLEDAVQTAAGAHKVSIKLWSLSKQLLSDNVGERSEAADNLESKRGVLVVDTLSLFHQEIYARLVRAQVSGTKYVTLGAISPWHLQRTPYGKELWDLVKSKLDRAWHKYEDKFEMRYEFDIGSRVDFIRWLVGCLPEVMKMVRGEVPDDTKTDRMKKNHTTGDVHKAWWQT